VVIFDSPLFLQGISARSNNDHLGRIESVVKYYKNKFNLPVWLFGHSDGSISVSEYLNGSNESNKLLAGGILSAGRDETRVTKDWKTPALVLHHEKDACDVTTFGGAQRYFTRIKEKNTSATEFATVVGGISSGAPCSTGYHMYEGAFGETLGLIEDFMAKHK
jgi:alpha-beta hydrolase superfamily lysophospholipase